MKAIICPKCGGNGVMRESEYHIPYILFKQSAKGRAFAVTCQRCNFTGKSACYTPNWPCANGHVSTLQEIQKRAVDNFIAGKESLKTLTINRAEGR